MKRTLMQWIILSALVVLSFNGCAAFRPMDGVPARYLPDELRGPSRADQRTIDLSLLRQPVPAAYLLDSGDVLGVYIEGLLGRKEDVPPVHFPLTNDVPPSLGYPMPVREDGTISLPVIGSLSVRGLTIIQAEQAVRRAYSTPQQILQPHQRISLALQQPRLYRVLVIRQEASQQNSISGQGQLNLGVIKRGSGKIVALPAYKNDVLHALADTGGLPGLDAENAIYVIRARHAGPSSPSIHCMPVDQQVRSRNKASRAGGQPEKLAIRGQAPEVDSSLDWNGVNRQARQPQGGFSDPMIGQSPSLNQSPISPMHAHPMNGFSAPVFESPADRTRPAFVQGRPFDSRSEITSRTDSIRTDLSVQAAAFQGMSPQGLPLQPQPDIGLPGMSPLDAEPQPGQVTGSPVIPWDGTQRFAPGHQMFGAPTPAYFDSYNEDSIPTIDNPEIVRIPIRLKPGEQICFNQHDITLGDGDIIFIESRDTDVFYTGGLLGGGQYTLPRDYDVDILGAIAIAQGQGRSQGSSRQIGGTSALNNDVTISASNAIILRPMPDGTQVPIQVNLYHALRNPAERVRIQPGDYVLLQYTKLEACGAFIERNLLEGALFGLAASQLNSGNGN